jgi:hypothetical protein
MKDNDMEEKHLIFQQYRLYSEQKEQFITRSFAINRFYLVVSIVLMVLIAFTKPVALTFSLSLSAVLAVVGMCTSVLWWMNMDSYNMLIKIKFSKVLEEIEKQLPVQPYRNEYDGIQEYRTDKKMFLFSDMQKAFSVLVFLVFFVALLEELIPLVLKQFI